jgi:hypothetical protein
MATKGDFCRLDLVPAILLSQAARERGRWRKNSVNDGQDSLAAKG